MDKQIVLRDFRCTPVKITIKDFDNVSKITCKVLSGDEVLVVEYKDGTKAVFDSSTDRFIDYFDGEVDIPLDKVDAISKINNPLELLKTFCTSDIEINTRAEDGYVIKFLDEESEG